MSHKTVTQRPTIPMPRQPGLLCRNGRYYFNFRIPTDLRPLYGKREFIREGLGISDYRKAIQEVRYRMAQAEAEFKEKRASLRITETVVGKEKLGELSDRNAHELVFRFLREIEKDSENRWETDGSKYDDEEREVALENLRIDEVVYTGGSKTDCAADGSWQLEEFLKREKLECAKGSPAYDKLRELFRLAIVENIQRDLDRYDYRGARGHQPIFREVFAHNAPPPKNSITLGELIKRYEEMLHDGNRSESTKKTYKTPSRLLCEVFGKNTRLDAISKDEAERLLSLLRRAPTNATKTYPGKTLEQAIEAADREGNQARLLPKSLENYFINLKGIFNFAVEKKLISENPFKDRDVTSEI